jgi:hypothetical protein
MAKICKNEGCDNVVPNWHTTTDGKKHNCQRRHFCFECSPFGQHNTKNLNNKNSGICCICGEESQSGTKKCYKCYFREKKQQKIKQVYSLVGYNCWVCNYNKGEKAVSVLEFHHMDITKKKFSIGVREFVGRKWDVALEEMKKCISICCLCHREIHAGIISQDKINDVYEERWSRILDP